ncbi:MAG TPA: formylglycine-generating enzyme family protein [Gemmatimonadaceae bacterium]|nr:formylglycine-generating enzyme family protein [Gemmatimonadaceae bacterium]
MLSAPLLLAAALVAAVPPLPRPAVGRPSAAVVVAASMARIPAGSYRPLYGRRDDPRVHVAAFALDREPVTRGEFLEFVRANPQWRRSAVRPLFAERGYLASWRGDLDAGDATDLLRPITESSWYAAKAYCAAQGKRLPTVDEWEYAAAASETRTDAARDPRFVRRLLALYAERAHGPLPPVGAGFRNAYGVRDLHGLAWEWTLDFNGVLVSDDSRETGSGVGARDHALFCASAAIGATDPSNYPAFMRYAFRAGLTGRSTIRSLGFRCAADVAP